LGVHTATLRRWIEAGRVAGVLRTPTAYLRVPSAVLATAVAS
jgi:hypothetical protein